MTNQTQAATNFKFLFNGWRSIGLWMSIILLLYILFNAGRAVFSPTEFATSYGAPLTDPANNAFVMVYAIRTLFLGLFGLGLLATRNFAGLTLFALVAVVMPLGDAALVISKGAAIDIGLRHFLIAAVLLLTWFLLWRSFRAVAAR